MADRSSTPPRIFGIPATAAPVVAVMRRGPTDWWQVGRWDPEAGDYEPGAWFAGALYPQKCDLSPDGRWFAYSAMKQHADWPAGEIYEAISRLPWLHALAAWEAGTTYTRGIHFTGATGETGLGPPDVGDATPGLNRYGIGITRPSQFAVERRRGWVETAETPPRQTGGPWDENRRVTMEKPRPGNPDTRLRVAGSYAAFRNTPGLRDATSYTLDTAGKERALDDLQWADWDRAGRLLVATTAGSLQIRIPPGDTSTIEFEYDLAGLAPDPQPPPRWAHEW